jgi:hypothetical protein
MQFKKPSINSSNLSFNGVFVKYQIIAETVNELKAQLLLKPTTMTNVHGKH